MPQQYAKPMVMVCTLVLRISGYASHPIPRL
jgi:hypothetical protein